MGDIHESEPARFLVEHTGLLPKGKVLDIAMGNGRNAVYLARHGFTVDGVDISPEAVSTAITAARSAGVAINAEVADLEAGYRIAPGAYDVIICFYYLQRSLVPQIKEGLRRGGVLVYETFTVDQAEFCRPRNPAHLLGHGELRELFRDLDCLVYQEGLLAPQKAIASLVARKLQGTGTVQDIGRYPALPG